jgi:predicted RNA binding protein YcfA (HicA-like mRNA interferase family)
MEHPAGFVIQHGSHEQKVHLNTSKVTVLPKIRHELYKPVCLHISLGFVKNIGMEEDFVGA